jgi:hypothetical protein
LLKLAIPTTNESVSNSVIVCPKTFINFMVSTIKCNLHHIYH